MQFILPPRFVARLIAAFSLITMAGSASAQHYTQVNLVSNQPGQAANTDLNLVNAWGIAHGTTPWWVADNATR